MKARHAHVIGGGIAGLATAACLGQRGWQVTVHERSPELREIGAGIGIKENSIRVMEELGCAQAILALSHRIEHTFINDRPGHNLRETSYGPERVYTIRRQHLHREFANAAESWGTTILLESVAQSVTPAGRLVTSRGVYDADLIVGADGLGSLVRVQSDLGGPADALNSGSTRVLIPRVKSDLSDTSGEYWRGHKRVLLMPMSDDVLYVCASSREDDARGVALPFDVAYWSASFPELANVFERIPADAGTHFAHAKVLVNKWHEGRIALVGDAAHAQPPNLGQGAGVAIANARALAVALEHTTDIEAGLRKWEAECMTLTRQVQNWSIGWEHFMHRWPLPLESLRAKVVLALASFPPTKRHWKEMYRGMKDIR